MFVKTVLGGLFTCAVGVNLTNYVGSVLRVEGCSMQPTLNPDRFRNDVIVYHKLDRYNVSRGDVVVLYSPTNPEQKIIKRVVGLEGDIISKIGNSVDIVRVPRGHIWVEGDNWPKSVDSNSFGPVPIGLIFGKAVWVIWPLNRIQILGSSYRKAR